MGSLYNGTELDLERKTEKGNLKNQREGEVCSVAGNAVFAGRR